MKNLIFTLLSVLLSFNGFSQNHALHFDGANDYVHRDNFSLNSTFTLSFWIKPAASANGGSDDRVVAFGPSNRLEIGVADSDCTNGNLWMFAYDVGVKCYDADLRDGEWHNIALVGNGETRSIYFDGILLEIFAADPLAEYGVNMRLGTWTGGVATAAYYAGELDEVRIWNVALSAQELAETLSCELDGDEENLSAYYNFNQGVPEANNANETFVLDATANEIFGEVRNFTLDGSSSNWIASTAPSTGLCNTTSTEDIVHFKDVQIFPNPVHDLLKINTDFSSTSTVQIYNALGEKMIEQVFLQNTELSMIDFAKGIYFVTITNSNKQLTQKVMTF